MLVFPHQGPKWLMSQNGWWLNCTPEKALSIWQICKMYFKGLKSSRSPVSVKTSGGLMHVSKSLDWRELSEPANKKTQQEQNRDNNLRESYGKQSADIYIYKHKALDKRQQLTGTDTFSIPCQNLHGNLLAFYFKYMWPCDFLKANISRFYISSGKYIHNDTAGLKLHKIPNS